MYLLGTYPILLPSNVNAADLHGDAPIGNSLDGSYMALHFHLWSQIVTAKMLTAASSDV